VAGSILLLAATSALASSGIVVYDSGFTQSDVTHRQSAKVAWYVDAVDAQDHVVSAFFFTSPSLPPDTFFSERFNGSGDFVITDSPSGDTMTVHVRPVLSPLSGACGTTFTVRGGTVGPHGGQIFVYTYQVQSPGNGWLTLDKNTTAMTIPYSPGTGCTPGTYKFRVRSALPMNHPLHSDWSRHVEVTVSA
jgi:hypothetical protein